jgi:hypothetical protein
MEVRRTLETGQAGEPTGVHVMEHGLRQAKRGIPTRKKVRVQLYYRPTQSD